METDLHSDQLPGTAHPDLQALECPVCFGLHNEEIHAASLSIRSWLRAEIQRRTVEPPTAITLDAA